jgi:DivIVA domain-containing protein
VGLTPEEIERREFASTLRGYDRDEVRTFLRKVGQTVRELQDEVIEVQQASEQSAGPAPVVRAPDIEADRFGAIGERVAELLRLGHDSAAELRANAESEAEDLLASSKSEAERMTSEAEALLMSARTQSDTMVGDARAEA